MIVSASYKTDIPTFYGRWFLNRLHAGYCKTVNPYGRQIYRIELTREAVDGFVFWTKNIGPFRAALREVHRLGYAFVIQHGVNGYPRELEHSVIDAEKCIDHLREIAGLYGPRTVVWRYDPIVFSSLTPFDFHVRNFEHIAKRLAGVTDEVVIAFANIYQKTLRNMTAAATRAGFTWHDPDDDEKRRLGERLVRIASASGMRLSVCSQHRYVVPGAERARCVDAERLGQISGKPIAGKIQGNRPDCDCYHSRDIGEYDTCPHGCVYCYAVRNHEAAARRFKEHDPAGEFLFMRTSGEGR